MLRGCDTVVAVVVWCCGVIAVPGCCGAGVIVVLCVRIRALGGCFFSSSSGRRHNLDLETLPCSSGQGGRLMELLNRMAVATASASAHVGDAMKKLKGISACSHSSACMA